MLKKNYSNINLTCTLQQDSEITSDKCLSGVISKSKDGFCFEEAIHYGRHRRNPKLFDGNFCSLVHMQNGKYKVHMKAIDASAITNHHDLAFKVYNELITALSIID